MAGKKLKTASREALKIAALYGLFSLVWLIVSDSYIESLDSQSINLTTIHNLKGALFVGVSATLLFVLLRRAWLKLQRSEAALRAHDERLERALAASGQGFWDWDQQTDRVYFSRLAMRLKGFDEAAGTVSASESMAMIHPDDRAEVFRALFEHLEGRSEALEATYRVKLVDGEHRWLISQGCAQRDADGKPQRIIGTMRDVTERKKRDDYLRQVAIVFESTSEGIIITDSRARILTVNRAFTHITGYEADEIVGESPRVLGLDETDREYLERIQSRFREHGHWEGELWHRRRDGSRFLARMTINPVHDDAGQVTHYVTVFSDITATKESEEQLEYIAHHDAVTGLPNRRKLERQLEYAVQRCKDAGRLLALIAIDVDRFKTINDSYGHPFGDSVLGEVARRLQSLVRSDDLVARFGGDEFMVLLEGVDSRQAAAFVAERIKEDVARPVFVDGTELFITASIGISVFPDDGADPTTLTKNADSARYDAKRSGGSMYRFYSSHLSDDAAEYLAVESGLHRALQLDEFCLFYQPQIELATGRVQGAEALIRWNHPEHGLLAPGRFLHVAETSGLMERLDAWVLKAAVEQAARWQAAGYPDLRIAVNLSTARSFDKALVEQVSHLLDETGLKPQNLELEVTEGTLMTDPVTMGQTLTELQARGIHIAIDDFGTGYSSLSHLSRFPVNCLKIDKSFVQTLHEDANNASIVDSVIALGHGLDLEVLAEGIETKAQYEYLAERHCDSGQGYFMAKPMPASDFEGFLARLEIAGEMGGLPIRGDD